MRVTITDVVLHAGNRKRNTANGYYTSYRYPSKHIQWHTGSSRDVVQKELADRLLCGQAEWPNFETVIGAVLRCRQL